MHDKLGLIRCTECSGHGSIHFMNNVEYYDAVEDEYLFREEDCEDECESCDGEGWLTPNSKQISSISRLERENMRREIKKLNSKN